MSDNELDELLSQLKETKKKSRHAPPNENHVHNLLKRIDVFINRRQMKLVHHQKRLDDLQRDLIHSESESSKNRVELEKKDFEVHQLHRMLNQAERTSEELMKKYDDEVKNLTEKLCNIQHDYERLKLTQKPKTNDDFVRLRERNKMLEIENQRLYDENIALKTSKSSLNEREKLRSLFNQSEEKCRILRLELQRVETEKEILKVELVEEKFREKSPIERKNVVNPDYEQFLRQELQINLEQANKLIAFWNSHKENLEEKIRQLTNEVEKLTKEKKLQNLDDISIQLYQQNESVLNAKRDINQLKMELTDKNTTIYNLHRKIECLEQALAISKQRNANQMKEIEDLRSRHDQNVQNANFLDVQSTDDESRVRSSIDFKMNLRTSSPINSFQKNKLNFV